jgi:hypothetical protein
MLPRRQAGGQQNPVKKRERLPAGRVTAVRGLAGALPGVAAGPGLYLAGPGRAHGLGRGEVFVAAPLPARCMQPCMLALKTWALFLPTFLNKTRNSVAETHTLSGPEHGNSAGGAAAYRSCGFTRRARMGERIRPPIPPKRVYASASRKLSSAGAWADGASHHIMGRAGEPT